MLQQISKSTTETWKEGHGLMSSGRWQGQQGTLPWPQSQAHTGVIKSPELILEDEETEAEGCYR